jgi:hypothetical protein
MLLAAAQAAIDREAELKGLQDAVEDAEIASVVARTEQQLSQFRADFGSSRCCHSPL